jgi:hypothetical protein
MKGSTCNQKISTYQSGFQSDYSGLLVGRSLENIEKTFRLKNPIKPQPRV